MRPNKHVFLLIQMVSVSVSTLDSCKRPHQHRKALQMRISSHCSSGSPPKCRQLEWKRWPRQSTDLLLIYLHMIRPALYVLFRAGLFGRLLPIIYAFTKLGHWINSLLGDLSGCTSGIDSSQHVVLEHEFTLSNWRSDFSHQRMYPVISDIG
jgi:hypothetical protein